MQGRCLQCTKHILKNLYSEDRVTLRGLCLENGDVDVYCDICGDIKVNILGECLTVNCKKKHGKVVTSPLERRKAFFIALNMFFEGKTGSQIGEHYNVSTSTGYKYVKNSLREIARYCLKQRIAFVKPSNKNEILARQEELEMYVIKIKQLQFNPTIYPLNKGNNPQRFKEFIDEYEKTNTH